MCLSAYTTGAPNFRRHLEQTFRAPSPAVTLDSRFWTWLLHLLGFEVIVCSFLLFANWGVLFIVYISWPAGAIPPGCHLEQSFGVRRDHPSTHSEFSPAATLGSRLWKLLSFVWILTLLSTRPGLSKGGPSLGIFLSTYVAEIFWYEVGLNSYDVMTIL